MYMCNHSTGRNFYPIVTRFGTQVGLVKSKVKFKEICYVDSIGTQGHHQKNYISVTFEPQV